MSYDICGDRQPGGTGFLCTLAPGHGGVMHEARARAATGGERTYAQWSTTMPRPQVRITREVRMAFAPAALAYARDTGPDPTPLISAFLEEIGIEVIE